MRRGSCCSPRSGAPHSSSWVSPAIGPVATADLRMLIAAAALLIYYTAIGFDAQWRRWWPLYMVIGLLNSAIPAVRIRGAYVVGGHARRTECHVAHLGRAALHRRAARASLGSAHHGAARRRGRRCAGLRAGRHCALAARRMVKRALIASVVAGVLGALAYRVLHEPEPPPSAVAGKSSLVEAQI